MGPYRPMLPSVIPDTQTGDVPFKKDENDGQSGFIARRGFGVGCGYFPVSLFLLEQAGLTMAGGYQVLEDVALADSAYEAWGESLSDLFEWASRALINTMVSPATVSDSWHKSILLEDSDISELLFTWLSQIVFLKDAEAVLFQQAQCQVWQDPELHSWKVQGLLIGAPIDPTHQELHMDVKAITKHLYEVRQKEARWMATIVVDV